MARLLESVLPLCALCLVWLPTTSGIHRGKVKDPRPNIVFVLADDYGFNDIGYHGSEISTPTLDKLASDGVKLENYYVQPICTPTRSCLMSGRYQIHTGLVHGVILEAQPNALPDDSPTLADKIKEAGYSTHMVGKWHLGFYKEKFLPWNRGFDTYFGYLNGMEDFYNHSIAFSEGPFCPFSGPQYLDLRDQNGPVRTETGHYSTHLFTQKAIDIVRAHDHSNPLFLYLAYQSVHSPLEVPKYYENQYEHIKDQNRSIYAGMTTAMDEGVKNLTQALKDSGLWENTVFIFSTDNGGTPFFGGNNFPLRGWKGSLWEGGVRGIGFVSGGKVHQRGQVNRELLHVTDWYPTLVGLARGNLNGTKPLDGFDQWETISRGLPSKRKTLLHNIDILTPRSGEPLYNDTFDTSVMAALRVGDLKLITGNPGNGSWVPPPGDDLHFIPEHNIPPTVERSRAVTKNVWLFNVTADPNEHTDLSDQMPEVVKSMLETLHEFNKTSVAPKFPPIDEKGNPKYHGGVWGPWQ